MTVTPSQLDVIRDAVQADRATLHTSMPAEVVRVHEGAHKRQFVDVQPSLQRRLPNETGELVDETLPIVPMVPVGYIQGGGFFISVPLAVGDIVTLHFAERSLDTWIETARKSSRRAVAPGDQGMHPLEGAYAVPTGPAPRGELLANVHAQNLVIGLDGGVQIHITPSEIRLGSADGAGLDYVALAAKVEALVDLVISAVSDGFTGVGEGSAASGSAAKSAFELALTEGGREPVAAEKTKAE